MTIWEILDIAGYISTIIVLISAVVGVAVWARGLIPALIRLGLGFSKREIAIFAKGDNFSKLRDLLKDSGLFKEKNIKQISDIDEIGKCEDITLYLLLWSDWKEQIDQILDKKSDGTGLVVYSPYGEMIDKEAMEKLSTHRNVTVNNFRGRLLSDIVVMMITTDTKVK